VVVDGISLPTISIEQDVLNQPMYSRSRRGYERTATLCVGDNAWRARVLAVRYAVRRSDLVASALVIPITVVPRALALIATLLATTKMTAKVRSK
jgi:hypothetical protein